PVLIAIIVLIAIVVLIPIAVLIAIVVLMHISVPILRFLLLASTVMVMIMMVIHISISFLIEWVMILTGYGEKHWFVWGCDYTAGKSFSIMGKLKKNICYFVNKHSI
ncbi:hypothetical protein V7654_12915, partial [Bacillus sp. JJ1609]|uniref:hypothetical protein n=1 Tax=Bacillus sp. JJ1609 TaxID=3122977 RepID=UPI002FFE2857